MPHEPGHRGVRPHPGRDPGPAVLLRAQRGRAPGQHQVLRRRSAPHPEGHVLGTLCVYDVEPRTISAEETARLQDLAALVVALFDRQRRGRREAQLAAEVVQAERAAETARSLQEVLLPHRLPDVDRVTLAGRYLPATAGAEVGGDWYDAVRTDGRVVFVVGDVQGHNSRAAALMGQVRTAVRAYVSEGHSPSAALERTNQLLLDLETDLFATCALVELDERTGEVWLASAGHPPPLLLDSGGSVTPLEVEPGPPLGVETTAGYPAGRHRLHGRSRLLLYTDGVAGPGGPGAAGTAGLAQALHRWPSASCEELADLILAPIMSRLSDDVALLLLDYAGPAADSREVRLQLPANVRAVREARAFLRTTLVAWSLHETIDLAELMVSELVTNALLHTGSPASLTLRHDLRGAHLSVGVEDGSTRHPQPRDTDDSSLGGRGMHIVETVAERWWVAPRGDGKTVWADLAVG